MVRRNEPTIETEESSLPFLQNRTHVRHVAIDPQAVPKNETEQPVPQPAYSGIAD